MNHEADRNFFVRQQSFSTKPWIFFWMSSGRHGIATLSIAIDKSGSSHELLQASP